MLYLCLTSLPLHLPFNSPAPPWGGAPHSLKTSGLSFAKISVNFYFTFIWNKLQEATQYCKNLAHKLTNYICIGYRFTVWVQNKSLVSLLSSLILTLHLFSSLISPPYSPFFLSFCPSPFPISCLSPFITCSPLSSFTSDKSSYSMISDSLRPSFCLFLSLFFTLSLASLHSCSSSATLSSRWYNRQKSPY